MAEISYPFAADSAGGGSKMLSQVQWQNMSHLWGNDRIDFQLTNTSYTSAALPFHAEIVGSDIVVQPGAAWVGGFYYKLDAPWTSPAPSNSGAQPRRDAIVIRADLSAGSVNLAIKTGTPTAAPSDPPVQRTPGGVWELPIHTIDLEANNGAKSVGDRRRFDGPGTVWVPWNAGGVSNNIPPGHFVMDMDSNQNANDSQYEAFQGRDGYAITRHLGKRRPYTPDLFTVSNKPSAANRRGFYRVIAPGTIAFSMEISNTSTKAVTATSSWHMSFTLPAVSSKEVRTILNGRISNPEYRNDMPNLVDIVGEVENGTRNCRLLYHHNKQLGEGLNGLVTIPGKSGLIVSGVFETNEFD